MQGDNSSSGIGMISTAVDWYHDILSKGDPRVKDWPLTDGPFPALSAMAVYLMVVRYGPKVMENRKPINMGHWLTAYNFALVGMSAYIMYELLACAFLAGYKFPCEPVDYSYDPTSMRMARAFWLYYISKYIETADTVFFVLRKKNNQITILHVFHHCSMIFNMWFTLYFTAGGVAYIPPALNSFVHVVMYAYYGLAAFGPSVQPYLWWKRYVTTLQLIQFLIVLGAGLIVVRSCEMHPFLINYCLFYTVLMLLFFSNFYFQAYLKKAKAKAKVKRSREALKANAGVQKKEVMASSEEGVTKDNVDQRLTSNGYTRIDAQVRRTPSNKGMENGHIKNGDADKKKEN